MDNFTFMTFQIILIIIWIIGLPITLSEQWEMNWYQTAWDRIVFICLTGLFWVGFVGFTFLFIDFWKVMVVATVGTACIMIPARCIKARNMAKAVAKLENRPLRDKIQKKFF